METQTSNSVALLKVRSVMAVAVILLLFYRILEERLSNYYFKKLFQTKPQNHHPDLFETILLFSMCKSCFIALSVYCQEALLFNYVK